MAAGEDSGMAVLIRGGTPAGPAARSGRAALREQRLERGPGDAR